MIHQNYFQKPDGAADAHAEHELTIHHYTYSADQ